MQEQPNDASRILHHSPTQLHPAAQPDNVSRLAPYLLLALTLLGGALRILALDSKGLWLDEAFSIWLARQPLPDLYAWLLKIDQHPPLYYVLLHGWIAAFGDAAGSVRLLSALFGAATIPVMFLLGRRLLGAPGGMIAAAILTVAPFHVRFAQETRMYTLLALNAALAFFFLARLLTDSRSASEPAGAQLAQRAGATAPDLSWLGLIAFTVATMLTHNTGILLPLSMNVFVLSFIALRRRPAALIPAGATYPAQLAPPSMRNWLTAQAAILLLWSPWLAAFVVQARGVYAEFWIQSPTLTTLATAIGNLFSAHLPVNPALIATTTLLFVGLSALGAYDLRRRSPALLALLLILFAAPIIGELLVSLRRPIFYDRTLIYVTLPIYLLMAAGVLQLGRIWRPALWAALIAVAASGGVSLHQYYTNFEKEQWREAAAYLADQAQAGDLLIFNATWVQIPFDYYFRDADPPLVKERGAPVDLFDRGVLEPKMTPADAPRLRELIRDRERVWLIYSHNWYTDPENIVPGVLGAELKLLERRPFVGLDVRLYGDAAP